MGSLWVVLGNLWEMATGSGDGDAATQPGADCISQPLKPHSALLPCTDCRERIGVENQLASGHTWRGAHTRGQVSLSQILFRRDILRNTHHGVHSKKMLNDQWITSIAFGIPIGALFYSLSLLLQKPLC